MTILYIERTTAFKKDIKLMIKRGKKLDKIEAIVKSLFVGEKLEPRHRDHPLSGNFSYARECHIEPDWLLIYVIDGDVLRLERTGSHSDLFK